MIIQPALCPCCNEHGDLWLVRFKLNSQAVLCCYECDSLWEDISVPISKQKTEDLTSFMQLFSLSTQGTFKEFFEEIGRWPRT